MRRELTPLLLCLVVGAIGCDSYEDRLLTVTDIADSAHVTIRVFGASGVPRNVVAYLDYPSLYSGALPDGTCWTSNIVATMDGVPMEEAYSGSVYIGEDRTCWGMIYVVDPVEYPYPGSEITEFRFTDASGEIVVRTRAMFEPPRLELDGDLVPGQIVEVKVLPSTAVLGSIYWVYFSAGTKDGSFLFDEDSPELVVGYDTVSFPVPADMVAPQSGILHMENIETGGAHGVEVTECVGVASCRAIRSGDEIGIYSMPDGLDNGYGPMLELSVDVVSGP